MSCWEVLKRQMYLLHALFLNEEESKTLEGGGAARWKEPEFQNDQVVGG